MLSVGKKRDGFTAESEIMPSKKNHGNETVTSPHRQPLTHTRECHGLMVENVVNFAFPNNTLERTAAASSNLWR